MVPPIPPCRREPVEFVVVRFSSRLRDSLINNSSFNTWAEIPCTASFHVNSSSAEQALKCVCFGISAGKDCFKGLFSRLCTQELAPGGGEYFTSLEPEN